MKEFERHMILDKYFISNYMIVQLSKLNGATSSPVNNTLSFVSRVRQGIWEAMDLIQRRHNFSTHHLFKMIKKNFNQSLLQNAGLASV